MCPFLLGAPPFYVPWEGGRGCTKLALWGVICLSIPHLKPPRIPSSCQEALGSVRCATDQEIARQDACGAEVWMPMAKWQQEREVFLLRVGGGERGAKRVKRG